MKLGLLLIALGVGYKVYADATREKGTLRSMGQWVGMIIMATSLVASAFLIYTCSSGKNFGAYPFSKMRMEAPALPK